MTLARVPTAVSLVALIAVCLPVAAQDAPVAEPAASGPAAMTPAERHDWERSHRVGRILGSEVHDRAGAKVGDIRDLVLDDQGRVVLAIVSTGGFLGVGDRLHAVPWDLLVPGNREDRVLGMDKANLAAAPWFTSKTWPALGDPQWQAENRRHYVH